MVQLLGRNKDGLWTILDTQEDLNISFNKSVEEIEDITQRKGSYSKTFTIPGTPTNDRFFRSVFDVNATDFNSTLQTESIIQNDGNDLVRGVLRLNKITVSPEGKFYEVYILEDVGSLSTELQEVNICDLDFGDISHEITYDNIISTWNYSGGSYDDYSGIVGKILYPLAHTGYDTNFSPSRWEVSTSGITNSGTPILINQFKPWINVKYLMDKVFSQTSFTYSSDFFNSDYFESLFMLMGTSNYMGAATFGDRPENQNFFKVSYGTSNSYTYGQPDQSELSDYNYFIFDEEEFDYLNTYTLATVPGYIGNYFTVPIDGEYQFIFRQKVLQTGGVFVPTFIDVVLRDIDTGTNLYTQEDIQIPVSDYLTIWANITVTLSQGQRVAMMFQRQSGLGDPYNVLSFFREDSLFEILVSPGLTSSLDDIKIDDNLECKTSLVFFRDIVKMFNLTVIPDGERNFKIEPYVNFLGSSGTTTYDWTRKLNLNSSYQIEPLDYSLSRELIFKYQVGNDGLSEFYFNEYNEIFGTREYKKQNNLLTGTLNIELSMSSMPCLSVGDENTTMVIPSLYKQQSGTTENQVPLSNKSKIGFYCGLVPFYSGDTSTLSTFYVQSGVTSQAHQYYPCVNHLSQLTDDPNTDFSDLNFLPTYDFFKTNTDFEIYTPNNLYRQFYQQYIDLLYSDDIRIFTGEFILTPEDIVNIKFNDKVVFLNSVWRLYEIKDGDITEESPVQCKFIKQPFVPSEITLVPPDYEEQQVTRPAVPPTPTPVGCYPHTVYYGTLVNQVCEGTAPTITYYSNCGILSGGCNVYLDSNCTTPVTNNTIFYPTSITPDGFVFIVSGQDGEVSTINCP